MSPTAKPSRRGSLRTQLIAWNVVALALLLGVLGIAVRVTVSSFLMLSVNRELDKISHRPPPFARGGGPRPDRGPDGMDFDRDHRGPGREFDNDRFPDPPNGEPDFPSDQAGKEPPPGQPHRPPWENDVFGPRMFNLQGVPLGNRPMLDADAFARAKTDEEVRSVVLLNGEPAQVLSLLLRDHGRIIGVTQAAYPLTDVYRAIRGVDAALLTLIPVGLLGAGAGGAFLTDRVLRRVRSTAQAAERIGIGETGSFSARLPVAGNDEFSELAQTFNGLLNRLEGAYALQTAALEQQRRFTADASHELKTPLTVIRGTASMALAGSPDENMRRDLQSIATASEMMSHLVQDLLLLARSDGGQMGKNQVEILIREVLERAISGSVHKTPPVTLVIEDETLAVDANETELVRLFSNLIGNATRHTPDTGSVTVHAGRTVGGQIRVRVIDTGEGIAPQHLPHLGERFYRVDESRTRNDGGTGLGLSICRSIVTAHDGKMTIESVLGHGTTVHVLLPVARS